MGIFDSLNPLAWVTGAVESGVGLIQNRNETRRRRNLIRDAYNRGQERLNINQQDVRQNTNESLIARGLAGGGDVSDRGPVAPGGDKGVGDAHTLGGQQLSDLRREQTLEQDNLVNQRDNAYSDTDAANTQGQINAISAGVHTAFGLQGAMSQPGGGQPSGSQAAGSVGAPTPDAAPAATPGTGYGTIRGAYGLDVLNPQLPTLDTTIGTGQANYNFRRSS
jgi:hypothetical protein